MSSPRTGIRLYKEMMRTAQTFQDYNFRSYSVRRIRDGFKSASNLTGEALEQQLASARTNLEVLRRQTVVSGLFNPGQKLSIEHATKSK